MADETVYHTADTIQPVWTFRDWAEEGEEGALINPDTIAIKVYDSEGTVVQTADDGDMTNEDTGVWSWSWVLPATEGTYTLEVNGSINELPTIKRTKVKVKFRPKT